MPPILRRHFLTLAAGAIGLASCGNGASTSRSDLTFVLVHGALHGGWCWRQVARILRSSGAQVFTPTLTGLGERTHLNGPHIDLSTHIRDIVNCIEFEELDRVVLVGHSYAGMVITGAAQQVSEKIAHLIYLDAVVPRNGESALEAMGNVSLNPAVKMITAKPGTDFGITDPETLAWVFRHITPQNALTLREPIVLDRDLAGIKRTYIACTADRRTGSPADVMRQTALQRTDATWGHRELATGHDVMVTAPSALAELLTEIA